MFLTLTCKNYVTKKIQCFSWTKSQLNQLQYSANYALLSHILLCAVPLIASH